MVCQKFDLCDIGLNGWSADFTLWWVFGCGRRLMRVNAEEREAIVVRVPSKTEILEKPYWAWFVCGGWIDSDAPNVVNVYWHRRQGRFTVFSLL